MADVERPKLRPICLLNDVAKVLETILADRLVKWMDDNEGVQLSNCQYGFRRNRSTCDALLRVQSMIEGAHKQ